jgi:hypothetical protein
MSKMQREKGASAEREAAELFRASGLFPRARRRATGEESQGDRGRDLDGTGCFRVQVKNSQRESPWTAINEASDSIPHGQIPVGLIRKNRLPFLIVLRPHDFFSILALAKLGEALDAER